MIKSKKNILFVSLGLAVSFIATSCYKDREELLYPDKVCANAALKGPKFAAVESIIENSCLGSSCHSTGGTEPDLTNSCNIVAEFEDIYKTCVVNKTMPYGGPQLSITNQAIITEWYNAGHKFTD